MKLLLAGVTLVSLSMGIAAHAAPPNPLTPGKHLPKEASPKRLQPKGEEASIRKISKRRGINTSSSSKIQDSFNSGLKMPDNSKRKSPKQNSVSDLPPIYGCIEYSESSAGIDHTLCKIPTNDSESFEVIIDGVNAIDGGTLVGNIYYGAYHTEVYGDYHLYINGYDITDGQRKYQRYGDASAEATDVAYNPVDGKVYGCFCDPESPDFSGYYFGTIDYNTGVTTRISDLPRQMAAIAINRNGVIYVIDKQQEKNGYHLETVGADLYTIDAATGEMTLIGKTGLKPEYRTSACIDPASGRLFWTVSPDDELGYLYEINTSTGLPTLIYTFPDNEEVVGLYIPDTGVSAGSPSGVEDLAALFPNGSLEGTVTFTLPNSDIDGNTLSGTLEWMLKSNGSEINTGSGNAGTIVSVPVTVASEGVYSFSVIVSNESGNSPEKSINTYIGHDTPVAPVVSARLENGSIIVSWNPVTQTVNGGVLDPAEVVYNVVKNPGGVQLYNNLSMTQFSEQVSEDELGIYSYSVYAKVGNKISEPGVSEKIVTGVASTPFNDDFNNIADFDYYTVIDNNGDAITWGPYIGNIQIAYNSDEAMDDWLITPPVELEKGKAYKFSVDVLTGNGNVEEKFEIMWGTNNNIEAMTNTVVELQSVAHTNYKNYHGFIIPQETGRHFVGIHGCSDADTYTITVDNLAISDHMEAGVPGEIEDFLIESHTDGSLLADISLKAPFTDLAGNALGSIQKVTVRRYGAEIKSFESPAPGSILSFTDEVEVSGNYEYSVMAENEAGEGPETVVTTFVGALAPDEVSNVRMVETSVPGEVTVTWEAPATDVKGNTLNPEYVKYRIYQPVSSTTMDVLLAGITETTATFRATENPDVQSFAQYVVVAETDGGISDGMPTPLVPVGNAYSTPFRESFSNGKPVSILGNNSAGGASWQLFNNSSGVEAADDDNGFIGSVARYQDDYGTLIMGKVDLNGLENPTLSFYTYSIVGEGEVDGNEIVVTATCNGESNVIRSFAISDLTQEEGWIKVAVPLDEYKDKEINLSFTSYARVWSNTLIDCVRVDNLFESNLSVVSLSAPEAVKVGEQFALKTLIENNSNTDIEEFAITLLRNGEVAEVMEDCSLAKDARQFFIFDQTFTVLDEEPQTFMVSISYPGDEYEADNSSDLVEIIPVPSTLPWVESLVAAEENNCVELTWERPNPELYIPDSVTEDFESCIPWATEHAAGWTFVDRDGGAVGGFSDGSCFPGIPQGSVQSFFVFDNNAAGFDDYFFNACSGSKFIAQMFSYNMASGTGVTCDDWAISPELCGKQQTVSLNARCFDVSYPETFEILYSEGSIDPEDFILAGDFTVFSDEWEPFYVELPAGARRMAVRCTSDFAYMLFVDDITFIPADNDTQLEVTGYRVYRNRELVSETSADLQSWIDESPVEDAEYKVSALYAQGESRLSKGVKAGDSGISTLNGKVSVYGGKNQIVVSNAIGLNITIYNIAGERVGEVRPVSSVENIKLSAGVYIVVVNEHPHKVIVK